MSEGWLKCQVFKGMFSDELAVNYRDKASVFVPKTEVQGEIGHEGRVRVGYFRSNGTTWAVLPTEYQESIIVNEADLVTP